MNRRGFLALGLGLPMILPTLSADDVRGAPAGYDERTPTEEEFAADALMIAVIGDWGAGGPVQRRVAQGIVDFVQAPTAPSRPRALTAIISTGDNIYPNGVKSVDDPQWVSKYERVYADDVFNVPWWAVLGNHDYRGDVDAQIAYGKKNPRWNMPNRTWDTRFRAGADAEMAVFGIDTQQLLQRSKGWTEQLTELETRLQAAASVTWKVVVGHHPMRSYGHYRDQSWMLRDVKPILERHGVHLYLCGHDHDLQVIRHPEDSVVCIVSGAGGGYRATAWGAHTKYALTRGGFATMMADEKKLLTYVHDAHGVVRHIERIVG